jgi:hypothetical protein
MLTPSGHHPDAMTTITCMVQSRVFFGNHDPEGAMVSTTSGRSSMFRKTLISVTVIGVLALPTAAQADSHSTACFGGNRSTGASQTFNPAHRGTPANGNNEGSILSQRKGSNSTQNLDELRNVCGRPVP